MPVEAGPTPDLEYLRVTQLGLQMDADFRAADEPPPTEASPPPGAAEEAERLLALFRDPSAAPGQVDLEGLRGLRGRARTQAPLLAEAAPAAAAPPETWQRLAGRLAGAGGGAAGQGGGWGPVRAALDVVACLSAEAAAAAPAEAAAGCAAHRPGGYGPQQAR